MPIPRPQQNEQRDQFIKRCMADSTMLKEYPNQSQRAAVANSQWRRYLKSSMDTTEFELKCAVDTRPNTPNKLTMVLYSGGPMRPLGYKENVVLDISGLKVSNGMVPILADHANHTDSVVGQGKLTVSESSVRVDGFTTEATSAGKRVSQMLREGIPLQASIGAKDVKVVRLARDEVINGRTVKAGTLVARTARLLEATVTPLGGDQHTSVLAASRNTSTSQRRGVRSPWPKWPSYSEEHPMNFAEFVASLGLKLDDLNDEQKTVLQAAYDNRPEDGTQPGTGTTNPPGSTGRTVPQNIQASDPPGTGSTSPHENEGNPVAERFFAALDQVINPDDDGQQPIDPQQLQATLMADLRRESVAERERQRSIDTLTASYSERVDDEAMTTLQATAIRENWHPDQFELELLRAARPEPASFAVHSSTDGVAPSDVIEASLLLASGRMSEEQVGSQFNEQVMNQASEARNRGYGLRRLAHETIQAAGMYAPPAQYDNNFVRTMLAADNRLVGDQDIYAATSMGGVSTVSVSGILSNVMHKLLLQSFDGDSNGMNSLQAISSVRSVNDFKDHHVYRLTADGTYQQISNAGDLKYMALQEAENSINASTYGVMMALNRHMIINDDLNAFSKIPSLIGRQARMKFLRVGWTVFLDNGSFYTDARGNLLRGVDFGIDGLTEAVNMFSKIRDDNGDPVDTVPRTVLVPSKYQVVADQVYRDTTILLPQKYGGLDKELSTNPHRGKYTPYSTSWIDGTGALVPGGDDDDWYIFSGEQDMLPLQVAYLNGNRTPFMERVELPADKLGMGWRSYFDFGFARQEWRGSIKVEHVVARTGKPEIPTKTKRPRQ